jgi:hypothetical protein
MQPKTGRTSLTGVDLREATIVEVRSLTGIETAPQMAMTAAGETDRTRNTVARSTLCRRKK